MTATTGRPLGVCRRQAARARWSLFGLGAVLALVACAPGPNSSLIDAYLEPQRPAWPGAALPAPVPMLSRGTQLVGMATNDLRAMLGEPALVRTEGGVQYWRYSFTGCILDLFVNRQADGSAEVVYFDLRRAYGLGDGNAATACERLGDRLEGVERLVEPKRELPPVESF